MVLDQGLWGGLPLTAPRVHLTLRLVFLDNSVGQFFVGYDALDGPRGWVVDTKGTSRWREVTFAINDGQFARANAKHAIGQQPEIARSIAGHDAVLLATIFDVKPSGRQVGLKHPRIHRKNQMLALRLQGRF
jgi:hypothetical protein